MHRRNFFGAIIGSVASLAATKNLPAAAPMRRKSLFGYGKYGYSAITLPFKHLPTKDYVVDSDIVNINVYDNLRKINEGFMKENEQVLVFPTEVFEKLGKFSGVSKEGHVLLQNQELRNSLRYLPRSDMEKDEGYKQIIPYCVICYGENENREYLIYQRTKKGGESRLHDLYSLGVGGHINPCDGEPTNSYEAAMMRELQEEINLSGNFGNDIIGAIYDDSNEVGRVHFGVVHLIKGFGDFVVNFGDDALDKGDFVSYNWLKENVDKFENWSKLVINELLDKPGESV